MVVETINIDIPLMLNDIPFEFKRLQFRLKVCFAMRIISFKGKLLKSQEFNLRKIVSPTGSFIWRVWILSSHQNLVILPPSSKMVKNFVYKEIL